MSRQLCQEQRRQRQLKQLRGASQPCQRPLPINEEQFIHRRYELPYGKRQGELYRLRVSWDGPSEFTSQGARYRQGNAPPQVCCHGFPSFQ